MNTIKRYLKQPSTWRGLALILSAAGIVIDPEVMVTIGAAIAGAIGVYDTVRDGDK